MKLINIILISIYLFVIVKCEKKKRKFDADFEFADEGDIRMLSSGKSSDKMKWIYDPNSKLCKVMKCKKKELCLMADELSAICTTKKAIEQKGDMIVGEMDFNMPEADDEVFYDSDDDNTDPPQCVACPLSSPIFICGTDNRTYSSLCRLDYHNCIHNSEIKLACKGFCPCRNNDGPNRRRPKFGKKSDKYKFIPEDLSYDNKHYKFIKYSKYIDDLESKKREENAYNDVLDPKNNEIYDDDITDNSMPKPDDDSETCEMDKMADRLLDWFLVLMQDEAKNKHLKSVSSVGYPNDCKPEVRWMFTHLDRVKDGKLSQHELYPLKHDAAEKCMGVFITSCDVNRDGSISRVEWCSCMGIARRPCIAALAQIGRSNRSMRPVCDARGYYAPLQCHGALGVCWCVDPHGVEKPGTRSKGRVHCSENKLDMNELLSDDEDSAGSGDTPLDF